MSSQSLINDALESRIVDLPEGMRDNLAPLLEAVETAADGTERDAALLALEQATAELPVEYRNALAPFFDNIDPVTQLDEQIAIANRSETIAELQSIMMQSQINLLEGNNAILGTINQNLAAQNDGAGLNSFAVGTSFVDRDQIANIHKGEIIITESDASILRKYGVPSNDGNSSGIITAINNLTNMTGRIGDETNDNLIGLIGGGESDDIKPDPIIVPITSEKQECSSAIF